MNEGRQAAALIGLILFIGIAGLFLTGGLPGMKGLPDVSMQLGDIYVDSYRADIFLNGTLSEQSVYRIGTFGKYRMLYRNIRNMPLSIQRLDYPYVELKMVDPPDGSVPYLKDSSGNLTILSQDGRGYARSIGPLAERNEAGCFMPQMFAAGMYRVDYNFRFHPFLECDQKYCHWNLMLADRHLPYRRVTIYVHDPNGLLVQLFPHPEMEYRKEGDAWVISGSSPRDSLLEVEMLMRPEASSLIAGFPRQVSDVKARTQSAQENGFDLLLFILRLLVLILPFVLAALYYVFGREKSFTVPNFQSFVPHKRKPWLVNMVFKGDAFDFDQDGFYATILDLGRRGIVKIDTANGTKIVIHPAKGEDIDAYERRVLSFLKENSWKDVFSARGLEENVKAWSKANDANKLARLHKTLDELLHNINESAARDFVEGRSLRMLGLRIQARQLIIPLVWAAFFIISFGGLQILTNPLVITAAIPLLQLSLAAFAPSALFGRWKGDFYREKMEWDAFRSFLSDFAMIQKYAPDDLDQWKEWLVYGTALGVGKKVQKAMADLNITIPEAAAVQSFQTHFSHAYSDSSPRSSGSGSGGGGGGGGFGSGGGGGGGGCGGR